MAHYVKLGKPTLRPVTLRCCVETAVSCFKWSHAGQMFGIMSGSVEIYSIRVTMSRCAFRDLDLFMSRSSVS